MAKKTKSQFVLEQIKMRKGFVEVILKFSDGIHRKAVVACGTLTKAYSLLADDDDDDVYVVQIMDDDGNSGTVNIERIISMKIHRTKRKYKDGSRSK